MSGWQVRVDLRLHRDVANGLTGLDEVVTAEVVRLAVADHLAVVDDPHPQRRAGHAARALGNEQVGAGRAAAGEEREEDGRDGEAHARGSSQPSATRAVPRATPTAPAMRLRPTCSPRKTEASATAIKTLDSRTAATGAAEASRSAARTRT